jgi:hypothetical protein
MISATKLPLHSTLIAITVGLSVYELLSSWQTSKWSGVKAGRFRKPIETVKQDMFMGTTDVLVDKFQKAEDMDMMIIFVRPTGNLGVISQV